MKATNEMSAQREAEALISKHKDIVAEALGEVKVPDLKEANDILWWIVEHKDRFGKSYISIRNWADDVGAVVVLLEEEDPEEVKARKSRIKFWNGIDQFNESSYPSRWAYDCMEALYGKE